MSSMTNNSIGNNPNITPFPSIPDTVTQTYTDNSLHDLTIDEILQSSIIRVEIPGKGYIYLSPVSAWDVRKLKSTLDLTSMTDIIDIVVAVLPLVLCDRDGKLLLTDERVRDNFIHRAGVDVMAALRDPVLNLFGIKLEMAVAAEDEEKKDDDSEKDVDVELAELEAKMEEPHKPDDRVCWVCGRPMTYTGEDGHDYCEIHPLMSDSIDEAPAFPNSPTMENHNAMG